jgi:hypothetical protein
MKLKLFWAEFDWLPAGKKKPSTLKMMRAFKKLSNLKPVHFKSH